METAILSCDEGKNEFAEIQKYAHVTFFFNGGVEDPNPGEDRILVPSSKVATFDMRVPERIYMRVPGRAQPIPTIRPLRR